MTIRTFRTFRTNRMNRMNRMPRTIRAALPSLLLLATVSAHAEGLLTSASSAGSSASSAGSASLRGSSDSIRGSSDSSSRDDHRVTTGEYRVTELAAIQDRADMLRVTVEPVDAGAGASGFSLDLPRRALGAQPLQVGDRISAQHRPYGIEFARVERREPFFLVLADDWGRDLMTRPLGN